MFWMYMLHCSDASFYVGHTDDLERRIAQHHEGAFARYTLIRRPCNWCIRRNSGHAKKRWPLKPDQGLEVAPKRGPDRG